MFIGAANEVTIKLNLHNLIILWVGMLLVLKSMICEVRGLTSEAILFSDES